MLQRFCSKGDRQFDVFDAKGVPLVDGTIITKFRENKRVVFGAFLDLEKVDEICSKHGLKFADR